MIFVAVLAASSYSTDSCAGMEYPLNKWVCIIGIMPRHSMYAIYAYIDPPNHPNVGIYGIHGAFGIGRSLKDLWQNQHQTVGWEVPP